MHSVPPTHTNHARKAIAALLALLIAIGAVVGIGTLQAGADTWTPTPAAKVADWPTSHEFPGHGDGESFYAASRNPGRIWTDKTVYTDETLYEEDEVADTNELIVSLSGLGSTRHITGTSKIPVDVVMVLDNSYSMVQCINASDSSDGYCDDQNNFEKSRAFAMAEAVNEAIRIIGENNSENRVALMRFGTDAGELVKLSTPVKVTDSDRYVTLTYKSGTMTLTAGGNKTMTIGKNNNVAQGTNTQAGIYAGMNVLATQTNVSGENQRVPNVLIFSDGETTLSYSSETWWSPSTATQGPNSPCSASATSCTQYYGNGFKAALTAAYLKAKITAAYNDEEYNKEHGTNIVPKVYTVGLGLSSLHPVARDLARATLDPSSQLGLSNTSAAGFTSAWTTYVNGGTPSVPVASGTASYVVKHPTSTAKAYDPTSLAYNDEFYEPMTTSDMKEAFESIAKSMVDSPHFPVKSTSGTPGAGYVTFTDPLGDFMEVSEVRKLYFCSVPTGSTNPDSCNEKVFSNPVKTTDTTNGVEKYTFSGGYQANTLAGETDVSKIVISVRKSESLAQGDVVTVQIPTTLLPLRDAQITLDNNGQPISMKQTASHPFHLDYSVAPKAQVLEHLADPMALNQIDSAAGTALAEYLIQHTSKGQVRFYAGSFTGKGEGAQAQTTVSFIPDSANEFYRFSTATPLFADPELSTELSWAAWVELPGAGVVYYPTDEYYYTANGVELVDRTAQITKDELIAAQDDTHQMADVKGVATVPAGLIGVNFPHTLDHGKCEVLNWVDGSPVCETPDNQTQTAPLVRSSQLSGETVVTRLGNNGYLAYDVPGALTITKEVDAATGLNPSVATEFSFQVELTDADDVPLTGSFAYAVFDNTNLTTPKTLGTLEYGGLFGDDDVITFTANQQVNLIGLPDGTKYTITEVNLPAGYTQTSPAGPATGQISVSAAQSTTVAFKNTYTAAAVTVAGAPQASKLFTGRDWRVDDEFTVKMCGPAEVTAEVCETVTFTAADHGAKAFEAREFTAPGNYTYTITEVGGQSVGVSYSGAEYQWHVSVTDNGSGQLSADHTLYQVRDDAGSNMAADKAETAQFHNTFAVGEVQGNLEVTKLVKDSTLGGDQLRAPALSHEFSFEYMGAIPSYSDLAPLFAGELAQVNTENAEGSSSVVSPALTFRAAHDGHYFYYKVSEVSDELSYVNYDDSVWFYRLYVDTVQGETGPTIQVTSAHCQTTQQAVASMVAANGFGECDPDDGVYTDEPVRFVNEYTPSEGKISITATKELVGRDWAAGDEFTFKLIPNDTVTAKAIADGAIWLEGSDEQTVTFADQTNSVAEFSYTLWANKQGNYQFALKEIVPVNGIHGVVYDRSVVVYDVVVDDLNVDGLLFPDVYVRGDDQVDPVGKGSFVNRYQATTRFSGVMVEKTLTGRNPVAGEFSFTVTPVATSTVTAAEAQAKARFADAAEPEQVGTMSVTNGYGNANPKLATLPGDFEFTQADLGKEFGYLVTEDNTAVSGVSYDTTSYLLTLRPLFDAETGKLHVQTIIDDLSKTNDGEGEPVVHDSRTDSMPSLTFVNHYQAAGTSVTPTFTKELVGRDWKEDESFDFTLTAGDDLTKAAIANGSVVLPEGANSLSITVENGTSSRLVGFDVGEISFNAAGEYTFRVAEIEPENPAGGLIYDPDTAEVTVTVTDEGTGQLVAEVEYDSNRGFVNSYFARHHWHIAVGKTLVGAAMDEGQFTFLAVPVDEASAQAADITMDGVTFTNSAAEDGEEALMERLSGLHLTEASSGTYCYNYSEVVPQQPQPGIIYDDTVYLLCATVTDDGEGHLIVDATLDSVDDAEDEEGTHETYQQSSADVDPEVPVLHFVNTCDPDAADSICAPPAQPLPGPVPPTEEPVFDPVPAPEPPVSDPAGEPVSDPGLNPTEDPTTTPTESPADEPTSDPADEPTAEPVKEPRDEPTDESKPSISDIDRVGGANEETPTDTDTPTPTQTQTPTPTPEPSSAEPTPTATSKDSATSATSDDDDHYATTGGEVVGMGLTAILIGLAVGVSLVVAAGIIWLRANRYRPARHLPRQ
ncbi:MAG: hypothetical protein LBR20_00315 [Propionibacteriaceae bacterium]|jgi:pilin isopeptide linkage protein|nr:hypothetical protein [Propionibacteriaceae bacterium]